jgi:uncharacterized protein (TIGR03000 family)
MRRILKLSLFVGLSVLLAGGAWRAATASQDPPPKAPPGAPVPTAPAVLVLMVPADAEVEIEGTKTTTQKGREERRYQSPPLQFGVKYHYTVKVTWKEEGKDKTLELDVPVRAGEEAKKNFVEEAKKPPMKDKDKVTDKVTDKDKAKDKVTDKDKPVKDTPAKDLPPKDKVTDKDK